MSCGSRLQNIADFKHQFQGVPFIPMKVVDKSSTWENILQPQILQRIKVVVGITDGKILLTTYSLQGEWGILLDAAPKWSVLLQRDMSRDVGRTERGREVPESQAGPADPDWPRLG